MLCGNISFNMPEVFKTFQQNLWILRRKTLFWYFVYAIYGMTLVVTATGANLSKGKHDQSSKCPYRVVDIEYSLSSSFIDQRHDVNTFTHDEGSSLDDIHILPVPISQSTEDCQNVPQTPCDPSLPYRTHDGSCNNLQHPTWGIADSCQLRLMPAVYDGSDGFRKSVSGKALPEPRDLSLNILPRMERPTPDLSQMFNIFGQFVAHDLMQTPTPTRNNDPCCPFDERNQAREECAPIFVKPDDPFYAQYNVTCMHFERTNDSSTCCAKGHPQKINHHTAVLDLNNVYGASQELSSALRANDGTGRLRSDKDDDSENVPPHNIGDFSNFCDPDNPTVCFFAGDDRIDMHATLTSMHAVFFREHNRLARSLKQLNPHWGEETLYQEARKILIGQWQHMIFTEYLPLALGPRHMAHFGLNLGSAYKSSTRIGTWLEMSTAGFRLHSMVGPSTGTRHHKRGLRFYETFMHPELIRDGCAEELLEGACRVPAQEFGRNFVEDMDGFFVRLPGAPAGLDTASIDIHRGRDNGLPPYVEMVEYLTEGTVKITDFDDLRVLMTQKHIELLKENYESVQDVDLWLGLQLEKLPAHSSVGFSSATLSALQFHHIKYGDRFYFEHTEDPATSFTEAQLTSLKNSSFSRMLCDNNKVKFIQKQALKLPSLKNPIVICSMLPEVDLSPWKVVK